MKKHKDNPLMRTVWLTKMIFVCIFGIAVSFVLMAICIPISWVFGGIVAGLPVTIVLFLVFIFFIAYLRYIMREQGKIMDNMGNALQRTFGGGFDGGGHEDFFETKEDRGLHGKDADNVHIVKDFDIID
ncbi:MAG: hypothetical protein FWC11_01240 [Firmicutes bacterium]|nr:hypothetical protein [Bacillota bacterium]